MKRLALFLAAMAIIGCAKSAPPSSAPEPIVVDPAMDILIAAADSIVPAFGPPDNVIYVVDSLTARVLDRVGATDRYRFVAPGAKVWCSGDETTVGTLARIKIDVIAGDSAAVGWMSTCLMPPQGEAEPVISGGGGVYGLRKIDDAWTVLGMTTFFEF